MQTEKRIPKENGMVVDKLHQLSGSVPSIRRTLFALTLISFQNVIDGVLNHGGAMLVNIEEVSPLQLHDLFLLLEYLEENE